MKEFVFLYRNDYKKPSGTPEEMEAISKSWMDWFKTIADNNNLSNIGHRLTDTGKVIKPNNVITNGPYSEIKESLGGYSVIKANNYDEAVDIAKSCPIFSAGGNVEVREIFVM